MQVNKETHLVNHKVNILARHWSRNNIHASGTGIKWNKNTGKFEAVVIRHLGIFDTAEEAGRALDEHINGVENWFVQSIEDKERTLLTPNDGRVFSE